MTILEEILIHKKNEVADCKNATSVAVLERSTHFQRRPISMKQQLLVSGQSGIIAEIKRRSPSKGVINPNASIKQICTGYVEAGASAISVLTDSRFFGGTNDDLMAVRDMQTCPILRKDFVIDEYQVIEAKSIGADVILLIAAALEPDELKKLSDCAHSLGMEVLLEVHNEAELDASLDSGADLVGVNNRNLKTFALDVNVSKRLAKKIPDSVVKVSESGIESPEVIVDLMEHGFRGFLIGQTFMQSMEPEKAAMKFIAELNRLKNEKTRR